MVRLPPHELEDLLSQAATRGARQALAEIALDNGEAATDIRDLRPLLQALRLARRTAWQTAVRVLTTVVLAALLAWAGLKLDLSERHTRYRPASMRPRRERLGWPPPCATSRARPSCFNEAEARTPRMGSGGQ